MKDDFYGNGTLLKEAINSSKIRNYLFNQYLNEMRMIVRPPLKIKNNMDITNPIFGVNGLIDFLSIPFFGGLIVLVIFSLYKLLSL